MGMQCQSDLAEISALDKQYPVGNCIFTRAQLALCAWRARHASICFPQGNADDAGILHQVWSKLVTDETSGVFFPSMNGLAMGDDCRAARALACRPGLTARGAFHIEEIPHDLLRPRRRMRKSANVRRRRQYLYGVAVV